MNVNESHSDNSEQNVKPSNQEKLENYGKLVERISQLEAMILQLENKNASEDSIQHILENNLPTKSFKELFNHLPIGIMEIDVSLLKTALDEYNIFEQQTFPTNIRLYYEMVKKAIDLIVIIQVNQKLLEILKASSQSEIDANYTRIFTKDSFNGIKEALKQFFRGKESIDFEIEVFDLEGEKKFLFMNLIAKKKSNQLLSRLFISCVDITKRKRIELALAESEERYSTFIHSSPSNYTLLDSELRIIAINKSAAESMNMKQEDVIGKHILEIAPLLKANKRYDLYKKALETGETLFLKDVSAEPFHGNYLDITAFKVGSRLGIITTDVTEKKKITKELIDSDQKFKIYTESSPIAIMIYQEFRCIYSNPSAEILTGYSFQELSELAFRDLVHPDYKEPMIKTSEKFRSDAFQSNNFESKLVSKNKSEKWVQIKVERIEYKGNRAALLSLVDITDLKTIQRNLITEKEYLAVTLRSIGDGVIATDINGCITLFNNIAEELTEWELEEVMDKNIFDIFKIYREDNLEQCEILIKKLTSQNAVVHNSENILVTKNNSERIISLLGTPIKDLNNNTIGTVIVFRDISEKRRKEQELFRAQKLESVGFLAGGIAHDFNNILSAMLTNISFTRMIVDSGFDPLTIKTRLSDLEKAVIRAKSLTMQLLTFSKGGEPIKKTQNIKDMLLSVASFTLSGTNSSCEFNIDNDLYPVEIDEGQISQVINNIVQNAKEAMPSGGIVKITATNFESTDNLEIDLTDDKYIHISIQDFGEGISKKIINNIFDPYFSSKKSGSGLGLAVSHSIIRNHNGFITVESKPSKGSTFHIYLPVSKKQIPAEISEKASFNSDPNAGRILVMDDEEIILNIVSDVLEYLNYTVTTTCNGEETIDEYVHSMKAGKKFDVVILDLTIPNGMGGKETIKNLLKIDPNVNAIVSSGYSDDHVMANHEKFGFKGVLTKPYGIEDIKQMLYSILKNKGN